MLLLTPPIPFNTEPFTKALSRTSALNQISLVPQYVCLNEEPEFDFYQDDAKEFNCVIRNDDVGRTDDVMENEGITRTSSQSSSSDIPPELPTRDYSNRELNTSYSDDIYEEPVIPLNSRVYKHHPELQDEDTVKD